MAHPYTILNIRLFLELTGEITDPRIAQPALPAVRPPASFISAAREELGLGGYRSTRHGAPVFTDFWNPRVEYIEPLAAPRERQAFFDARATTLWEACCSQFETLPPRPLAFTASLLVEYELSPDAPLSEEDSRFLFLDCKRRYIAARLAYRQAYREIVEPIGAGGERRNARIFLGHDLEQVVRVGDALDGPDRIGRLHERFLDQRGGKPARASVSVAEARGNCAERGRR